MKVLIFGGSGMLGHKLGQRLSRQAETYLTFRKASKAHAECGLYDPARALDNVSAENFDSVVKSIAKVRPDVVVNCIGIVKQDAAAKDPLTSINVNALFPHRLAQLCLSSGTRLIHISTDCVFSGRKGHYEQQDFPDAEDLYGRTKLLGEVDYENCLTLRTSMIGRELSGAHGLLEWFLSQEGKSVKGFKRAVFSGFTTNALSEIIAELITKHTNLRGVWHVAAGAIDKFELLRLIKSVYGLDINITPDETFICDRSLNAHPFREATGLIPPSWPDMIKELYEDSTPYEKLRRNLC